MLLRLMLSIPHIAVQVGFYPGSSLLEKWSKHIRNIWKPHICSELCYIMLHLRPSFKSLTLFEQHQGHEWETKVNSHILGLLHSCSTKLGPLWPAVPAVPVVEVQRLKIWFLARTLPCCKPTMWISGIFWFWSFWSSAFLHHTYRAGFA